MLGKEHLHLLAVRDVLVGAIATLSLLLTYLALVIYMVVIGEWLQTRRPRKLLGTGHMVFSQSLTRKTLRFFSQIH